MTPQGNQEPKITFKTHHSATKRFWHWTNFTLVALQLLTVFFAWIVLSTPNTVASIERVLTFTHTTLPSREVQFMAHSVNDQIWQWHKYFGYTLAVLLLFRIIIEFFQSSDKKIYNVVKRAIGLYKAAETHKGTALHYLYSKLSYVVFYFVLIIQVITGFSMAFGRELGIPRAIGGVLHGIHETDLYIILAYVILHIGGVLLVELRKGGDKGIVSDMINGGEKE